MFRTAACLFRTDACSGLFPFRSKGVEDTLGALLSGRAPEAEQPIGRTFLQGHGRDPFEVFRAKFIGMRGEGGRGDEFAGGHRGVRLAVAGQDRCSTTVLSRSDQTMQRGMVSMEEWTPELMEDLHREARAAGFDKAGVAAVEGLQAPEERMDAERFEAWIEAGRAGEMEYLKRRDAHGRRIRSSAQVSMPWARSVVVCAMNYNADGPRSVDASERTQGWIGRYAWGGRLGEMGLEPTDYHDDLLGRMERLREALRERLGFESRCYVDTGPLVERSLAARAGVGWIGKNTCVLEERLGSWLLLGTMVTSIAVPRGSVEVAADRCGSCTRCIDACPTQALVAPREMDATRCIAYLTIEKKGEVAEELRGAMGRQVFGCDICQEVCPWNRRAPVATAAQVQVREDLINPDLGWLGSMSAEEFRRLFRGSPLERTKLGRVKRNVAIAMGNSGDDRYREQLEQWSAGEDAVLAATARWARARLQGSEGADEA